MTVAAMKAAGLGKRKDVAIKVLAKGEITKPLTVHAHAFSASARAAIEAAGGTLPDPHGLNASRHRARCDRAWHASPLVDVPHRRRLRGARTPRRRARAGARRPRRQLRRRGRRRAAALDLQRRQHARRPARDERRPAADQRGGDPVVLARTRSSASS